MRELKFQPMKNKIVGLAPLGDFQYSRQDKDRAERDKKLEIGAGKNEVEDAEKEAQCEQVHDFKPKNQCLFLQTFIDFRCVHTHS